MSTISQTMRRVIRRRDAGADARPAPEAAPTDAAALRATPRRRPSRSLRTTRSSRSCRPRAAPSSSTSSSSTRPPSARLREAGVALVVPLVSGGELVGTLNLGPRLSDQQYSTDDRRLLDSLAAQAAPALQVAELVQRQAAEAASRERIEQELRVAQLIQQNFLPRELPELAGWQLDAYYKPAREVGGDFYDFFELPDGRVGVVVGDVTDKGVPAAMVMARRAERPARDGGAGRRAGRGARARQRAPLPRHPRQDVRHLPLRRARSRVRPLPLRERRPQPAVRAHRRRRGRAARDRHAARPDARHELRGGRRPRSRPARRCCSTPTASPRRTRRAARCSASRGCAELVAERRRS